METNKTREEGHYFVDVAGNGDWRIMYYHKDADGDYWIDHTKPFDIWRSHELFEIDERRITHKEEI